MKHLQWFPGHMTKAMRMMEESVRVCDGIIYVLDARCPASSYNKNLKKTFGSRPVLYVLNKCDLADNKKVDEFVKLIRERGGMSIKLNAVNANSRRDITGAISSLVAEKQERSLAKGYNRIFRFMVCGVPNTGKSTLINLLSREKRAATGDKAGVTRGKQWIRLPDFELLDTPGTMPPAFDSQLLARHLAYIGSINDDILDMEDIAFELLGELAEKYPERLTERYGIAEFSDKTEMYETLCRRRGFVLKGGELNYERGAKALLDDFRKGRIGRVCLESAADYSDLFF